MKVKPAIPGAVIRDPHTKQPIPDEGGDVPNNNFWNRRLLDGDVVLADEPNPERAAEVINPTGREPVAPLTTRNRR